MEQYVPTCIKVVEWMDEVMMMMVMMMMMMMKMTPIYFA